MDILLNPNIAYLVLVAATFFILMAIIVPGTGAPEVLGLFSLVFAGYAVYHLSFNWWALALLMLSVIPFIIAIRGRRRGPWLVLSVAGIMAGSVLFFPAPAGLIAVNPLLAIVTTVLYAAFLWISARKAIQIAATRPAHDLSRLVGQKGEAKTAVRDGGSVQVAGELWSARSEKLIPAGMPVRIAGRDGFVLIIEEDRQPDLNVEKE